jgi:hypothetical protein
MIPDNDTNHDYPHHVEQQDNAKPTAYKVEDDDNLEEKDLKRSYIFGDSEVVNADQAGMESHGMGGESFGENSVTPAGDDPANKSRNAGYSNDYFKRVEPSEEHPEHQNFKAEGQEGAPDPEQGGSSTDTEHFQEGTADDDGKASAAGNAAGNVSSPGQADYKEEYDSGTPDYGSNSPEDSDEVKP